MSKAVGFIHNVGLVSRFLFINRHVSLIMQLHIRVGYLGKCTRSPKPNNKIKPTYIISTNYNYFNMQCLSELEISFVPAHYNSTFNL